MTPRDKRARTERFLRMVNLWDHRRKLPAEISGGMRQRTAIARAFAVKPDVLLLDEPFGALDALTKGALHDELLALWRGDGRRQTILMVTHDIDEAIYLADRVVVMTDGPAATIREVISIPLGRPATSAARCTTLASGDQGAPAVAAAGRRHRRRELMSVHDARSRASLRPPHHGPL